MHSNRRFLFSALIILLLIACNLPVLQDGLPFSVSGEESVEAEGVSVTPTMPPHLTRQPAPAGPDAPTALNVGLQVRNELDVARLGNEVLSVVDELAGDHPEMGALVIECTDLPPFAHLIQEKIGVPVFDIVTLTRMVYDAVVRSPFQGIMPRRMVVD